MQHKEVQMLNMDLVAPAGAIVSNINDLLKWTKFLINFGACVCVCVCMYVCVCVCVVCMCVV